MAHLFAAWRNGRVQIWTRNRLGKMANNSGVQSVPVGALYGLPGFTERFEQYENLQNIITTVSAASNAIGSSTPFNPPASFQKTDIVFWWEMECYLTEAATFTAGGITWSPEAPYNKLQALKLKLQGQYTPIEVESGMDAAFMQMYRPMRGRGQRNTQDLMNSNVPLAAAYPNSTMPQANLAGSPAGSGAVGGTGNAATGVISSPFSLSNYPFVLELPAGIFVDEYWDLALDGSLLPNAAGVVAPSAAFVSPQYMGGGERVIVPQFNVAPLAGANYDQFPAGITSALTLTAGTVNDALTVNCRRVGVFASENPAELPPVFNWQYRRASKRVPIGAVTKVDIPITEYGQVLSTYVRIFDPTTGQGSYYNIANITKCQVLYGSNLPRFDDDPATMQDRFIEQHGFLPPQGTVVWDMAATGFNDNISNARALNTLTNANTHIHLEMSVAPGANAYAVIGTELLVPVSVQ
jgi:hypothetical protein